MVVVDAHAGFCNVLPDRLDRRCTLLRGQPRKHSMLSGINRDVSAVCLVGYHGKAGTDHSVLAHTVSGAVIAAVRCNGVELGEFGLNAALAAHFDVPTVLATGDDTLVAEAKKIVPGITTVEVKRAFGNRAAESLHPEEACARIEAGIQYALAHLPAPGPVFTGAVDLEVDVHRPLMTELACLIPGVQLRGPLTVGIRTDDFVVAYNLIDVFTVLAREQ